MICPFLLFSKDTLGNFTVLLYLDDLLVLLVDKLTLGATDVQLHPGDLLLFFKLSIFYCFFSQLCHQYPILLLHIRTQVISPRITPALFRSVEKSLIEIVDV